MKGKDIKRAACWSLVTVWSMATMLCIFAEDNPESPMTAGEFIILKLAGFALLAGLASFCAYASSRRLL